MSRYYHFYQQYGPDTDNYARLSNEVQYLIDSQTIPEPEKEQRNTHRNPLPHYRSVPPPTYIINSGLPEDLVLRTFDQAAFCLGIWDSSSEDEVEKKKDFWKGSSSSDEEEEVKGMTRSGRFYNDTVEKGKEVLTDS